MTWTTMYAKGTSSIHSLNKRGASFWSWSDRVHPSKERSHRTDQKKNRQQLLAANHHIRQTNGHTNLCKMRPRKPQRSTELLTGSLFRFTKISQAKFKIPNQLQRSTPQVDPKNPARGTPYPLLKSAPMNRAAHQVDLPSRQSAQHGGSKNGGKKVGSFQNRHPTSALKTAS